MKNAQETEREKRKGREELQQDYMEPTKAQKDMYIDEWAFG